MQLFYRRYGDEADQPVIILHGLFGISDNWVTYARRLAMEGFNVWTIDQRNHGQSPQSPNFNYLALTDDLFDFIDEHEIEDPIIIGHSMGGKVAMRFVLENPHLVKKMVVVDITLKSYGPRNNHKAIIQAMKSIDFDGVSSRGDVENQIKRRIPETRIRQFIMKNLHRTESDRFEWQINIEGIEPNLDKMFDGIDTINKFEKPTLFVRGGDSDYILPSDYDQIRYNFPNAEIVTIEGASHWVHVEAAEKFYTLTMGFVSGSPSWYMPENLNI
ncbi:MAG: alpha/beta fold hydrolase [Bacteroidales bacterium]|nr:alpha/beta fold hydrolase [Bacteroidales bacterium]